MDLGIIKETIQELENGKTTYDSCLKLASLYILKDHMYGDEDSSPIQPEIHQVEYNIADEYQKYKDQYARGEIVGNDMMNHLKQICAKEKENFIKAYSLADTDAEKLEFKNLITELTTMMKP